MQEEVLLRALAFLSMGFLMGYLLVPQASNWALERAVARSDTWWADSLEAYRLFKEKNPHREPSSVARGAEGALGMWRDDVLAEAVTGRLSSQRMHALAEVGMNAEGLVCQEKEVDQKECCLWRARRWQRALCGAVIGVVLGAFVLRGFDFPAMVLFSLCVFGMAVGVICDVRARIIPLESCALIAAAGVLLQGAIEGLPGVFAGLTGALVLVVGCLVVNRIMAFRHPGGAVGWGDVRCMGALALATGVGSFWGFAVCYVLAAGVALTGCALKRLSWSGGIPMAPFLAFWLGCGVLVCMPSG